MHFFILKFSELFPKDENDGVKSFVEKLHEFRDAGRVIGLARTRVEGIIMPAERLITILTKKKGCDTFAKLERAVQDLVPQYRLLFNHTERFMEENPGMDAEGILDIMDSFVGYIQTLL